MAQMYSISGSMQVNVIKKHSSVVGFTTATSKKQISTLSTAKVYIVFMCICFAYIDSNFESRSCGC